MDEPTAAELKTRISTLRDRIITLNKIMSDFQCPDAKKVLEMQIDNYRDSIKLMESGLCKPGNQN